MTQPPTQTKPRTPSMRWIKLSEGKDPEFDNTLFLTDVSMVFTGRLVKIEQTEKGKIYSFEVGNDSDGMEKVVSSMTHFCYPVLPND
jgi:hypothetical protein